MRRTTYGLGAAAMTAALLLAGCGAGGAPERDTAGTSPATKTTRVAVNGILAKPAKEIVSAAAAAFRSARSVRVNLTADDANGSTRMDLKLTRKKEAAGWIENEGVRIDIIAVAGGTVYMKSRKLWEQVGGAEAAKLIGDRWVRMPLGKAGELTPFIEDLTIRGLADNIFSPKDTPMFVRKSGATMGGRPAVRLQALDGSYYVAATGKPYPLLLDSKGKNDVGFSQYDQDFAIKAPPDALDFDKLQG